MPFSKNEQAVSCCVSFGIICSLPPLMCISPSCSVVIYIFFFIKFFFIFIFCLICILHLRTFHTLIMDPAFSFGISSRYSILFNHATTPILHMICPQIFHCISYLVFLFVALFVLIVRLPSYLQLFLCLLIYYCLASSLSVHLAFFPRQPLTRCRKKRTRRKERQRRVKGNGG